MEDKNNVAIKCEKCGKFFNKSLGVCPFCGNVLSSVFVENFGSAAEPSQKGNQLPALSKKTNQNNDYVPKNKSYLWLMLACLSIAQIITWFVPWTKLSTDNEIIDFFANPKIHYLNYLESPANILNSYYDEKVHTVFYVVAALLMTVSIGIIFIYFILSFSKKYSGRIKGTIASVCMIVASLFVELYRLSLNSALENSGLDEAYTFLTSGVFVVVILLSVLAMVFGNNFQKRPDSNTSKSDKTEEPSYDTGPAPSGGIWQQEIEDLDDKELFDRYNDEYQRSSTYRELCYRELRKRNLLTGGNKQKNGEWICPECVRKNDVLTVVCKCGHKRNFANEDPKQKETFLNRIFDISPEYLPKEQQYFQNDNNPNIIIRYTGPATIHVFRRSEKDWVLIPQDNSYLRELMMGQGNNCMTEISIEKAKEIIGSWF